MHDEGNYRVSRALIRGSNVGIRIFAVGVLVVGLGVGLTAGVLKHRSGGDSLEVRSQAGTFQDVQANFQAPPVDTDKPQGVPAGGQTAKVKAELAAQAKARAIAQAKAEAARRAAKAKAEAARKAATERASRSNPGGSTGGGTTGGDTPPIPVDCKSFSGNRATGCALLAWAGFDTGQMSCLDPLWKKESGWNHRASNPSSGAYGIPQALPGSKMSSIADDWRTNPVTQIKWGLNYIKGRYSTPCAAWEHSQNSGWY
jgi:hypothetical protein